jgi:hypothetical protein
MKLYIGVTKDEELYYIEWDKADNEQRKTFTLSSGTFNEPKTEQQGEQEAKERLSTSDYWDDLGMIDQKSFLTDFIDFDEVAEHVLNIDGWENVNGEYTHFGEYNEEEIYLNYSSGGQHKEEIKDLKELWINKEDLKKVYSFWDKEHLKPLKKETLNFIVGFFEKYKELCDDQTALNKYLDFIKW